MRETPAPIAPAAPNPAAPPDSPAFPPPLASRWAGGVLAALRGGWRLLTLNRKVSIGSATVGFFIFIALFGPPLFVHQDPNHYTLNILQPPSAAHWLGTNQGGQDLFGQLVLGTRSSVGWSFFTAALVLVIAVTVGLVSGYFGGFVDDALSVITNVFLVIPPLPLAIVAAQYFARSTLTVALVVALTNWTWGARTLRAQTLSIRNREFVTAAKTTGERTWRIIFFEIFPNQISIVAASFVTTTIQVILAVAGLEFLGLGNNQVVSWGIMLNAAYNDSALLQGAWWWFVPPGLCIALLGAGLALINFGIDEIADPRLRQGRRRQAVAAILALKGRGTEAA